MIQVKSSVLLSVAIILFFTTNLTAQHLSANSPKTAASLNPISIIEFEKTSYNFGVIEEGTIVSQTFTFSNTGDVPLIITNVRGNCGCTVPKWPRDSIMPGETASLTVIFNSEHQRGNRSQGVVTTANTEPAKTPIYLIGKVVPRNGNNLAITPSVVRDEPTIPDPSCFIIYPNPTSEVLNLDIEDRKIGQPAVITIYSNTGQLMARREVKSTIGTIEFNVGHFPAGTYTAYVQVGKENPEARCFVVVE